MQNLLRGRMLAPLTVGASLVLSSLSLAEPVPNRETITKQIRAFEVTFSTEAGEFYTLQRSDELENWTDFGQTVYGTGNEISIVVPDPDRPREFYRARKGADPANLPDLLDCKIDWERMVVDPMNDDVRFSAVAVAPDDSLVVAYTTRVSTPNGNRLDLHYAAEASGWAVDTVAVGVGDQRPHVEVGADSVPRIAFRTAIDGDWSVATKNGCSVVCAGDWCVPACVFTVFYCAASSDEICGFGFYKFDTVGLLL